MNPCLVETILDKVNLNLQSFEINQENTLDNEEGSQDCEDEIEAELKSTRKELFQTIIPVIPDDNVPDAIITYQRRIKLSNCLLCCA